MSMRKLFLLLAALAALVVAAPALAARITGGTTTVTPSKATAKVLSDNGITVTAIAPATVADGAFTFPIARGRVGAKGRAIILHRGGLKLTKGEKSISLRHPVIVLTKKGGVLAVRTHRGASRIHQGHRGRHHGRHHRLHLSSRLGLRRLARLSEVTRTGDTITATLTLTKSGAKAINRLAGSDIAKAGDILGTVKITPTRTPTPTPTRPQP